MAGQFILKTVSPEVVTGNRQPLYIGGTDPLGTDGVIVVGADGIARIGDQPIANSSIVQLKNWIINGQFDVWQRGTSQTSDGYGSDDRWINTHYISTKTHSRQLFTVGQTDVPNNPKYFSRTVVTSGNTSVSYVAKQQLIEDVTRLSGKTVSLSFWAKADANKNISIEFVQNFGTGGSTQMRSIGITKYQLTTSWQKFTKTVLLPSVSGKTINDNNFLAWLFWFDAGSDYNAYTDSLGNQSGTFDIANVCLVEGSIPVECPNESYDDVLRKCQRYFEVFYVDGMTIPSSFIATSGNSYPGVSPFIFNFKVTKRTTPNFSWAIVTNSFGYPASGTGSTISSATYGDLRILGNQNLAFFMFAQNDTSFPASAYIYGFTLYVESEL